MNETVVLLNTILASGSIVLVVLGVFLLLDIFLWKRTKFASLVRSYGMLFASVLTVGASLVTLAYSDIFGFVPCGFCWFQRILLFPQALMLPTAYFFKEKHVALYGLVLSVPGLIISIYHHYIQMGGSNLIGCPTAGPGADCAKRIIFEFGFVTFPFIAGALFFFLCVLYAYMLLSKRD